MVIEQTEAKSASNSKQMFWAGALFFVGYLGALAAAEKTDLPQALRIALSLVPVAAFAWFLKTMIAGIRELDELERRIQLEALAVAFPLTLLLVMMLGLLQRVVYLSPHDWSYRHVWPFIVLFYLGGLSLARRRYQ